MLNLYPHHIFFDKVFNQITYRKNKLWRFLPVNRISLSGIGEVPSITELKTLVKEVLGDVDIAAGQISDTDRAKIYIAAEQTIAHQFEYLGSGKVYMPSIRWHEDFRTDNKWQKGIFYLKQRELTANGADIKVPWELSRGHHLLWLGEAFLLTKDEKYAKEVLYEIEDWLKENPFMYSVNWNCTMDVAIRAVNWMYAVAMVINSPSVSDSFVNKLYRSLYQHAWFIYNNLERTIPYSNNHLFSDLAGLLYLSLLFRNNKQAKRWLEYSITALYEEIRCQVLPSGVHFERSVSYHRLMTEMVIASLSVLKRNGFNVPADIEYRGNSMLSYIQAYTKPNHLSPLVEDNDDGRFLPFVRRDFRQHDYLLDNNSAEMLFINNGIEAYPIGSILKSRLYHDAGHAILRRNNVYLFVTNGEQSGYVREKKEIGTHTHNDKLSFELSIGEDDIIIDPGAYIYTPDPKSSNEFRSTQKHNTVIVDGEEQNGLSEDNVFLAIKNSLATLFKIEGDANIVGQYYTFEGKMTHNRKFKLCDDTLKINDVINKEGNSHQAIFSFHLAENIQVSHEGNRVNLITPNYHVTVFFETVDNKLKLDIIDDTVSPSYGVKKGSKTIRISRDFNEVTELNTIIEWQRKR